MGESLKELVVLRYPRAVHVYNVVPHGRRHFRSLVWTSDPAHCLRDLAPVPWHAGEGAARTFGGDAAEDVGAAGPSLVITRNLDKALGVQVYMPARLLQGLVPSALLEHYLFWQNEDDSLSGYETLHATP